MKVLGKTNAYFSKSMFISVTRVFCTEQCAGGTLYRYMLFKICRSKLAPCPRRDAMYCCRSAKLRCDFQVVFNAFHAINGLRNAFSTVRLCLVFHITGKLYNARGGFYFHVT